MRAGECTSLVTQCLSCSTRLETFFVSCCFVWQSKMSQVALTIA